LLLLDIVH